MFLLGYLGPAGLADDNAYSAECIGGATGEKKKTFFIIFFLKKINFFILRKMTAVRND